MDDLVEFLRARLDEDADVARAAACGEGGGRWEATSDPPMHQAQVCGQPHPGEYMVPVIVDEFPYLNDHERAAHIARQDPDRVLAEVDAKRRLLNTWLPEAAKNDEQVNEEWGHGSTLADDLLRLLALPYADHSDYQETWKP